MFRNRLRALREGRDLTQADLGEVLRVSKQTISNYENGVSSPDQDMLLRIADYFGVSTDYLLGRTNVPSGGLLDLEGIIDKIAEAEDTPQEVVDEALRRIAIARETLQQRKANAPSDTQGTSKPRLPDWVSKLPPDMQEFVREESKHGWPYLRLARGLKMKDLSPAELEAIVETWMDAKRRYEEESGE